MNAITKIRMIAMACIMVSAVSCSDKYDGDACETVNTKSQANSEYRIRSLNDLPFMDYVECEEYAVRCAELHNQALCYVYEELREIYHTNSRVLYDMMHHSDYRNSVCDKLVWRVMDRLEEEYSELEGMAEYLNVADNIPWEEKDMWYRRLFYEYEEYAYVLENINGMYSAKSPELFAYFDGGMYEDIYNLSNNYFYGSYAPTLPLIFGQEMFPRSLKYWQTEYYNWFELFMYAEEENGDGGEEGEGSEEGGDDQWKEDLKYVGIVDAVGAVVGAVDAVSVLGAGLSLPGANLGVGVAICVNTLRTALRASLTAGLLTIITDVRVYQAEGIYPSHQKRGYL